MIGKIVSHYRIFEKLGEGGMGVVYKAEDLQLTRTVALKFLPHGLDAHQSERGRFLQEARAAALLNHPNICTIHDIQEHEGQPFIVMEYVEGKTLREIVPVQKMQEAIGYAIQIAEALEEAHAKGIVHRDIKAENIMVNTKHQAKVMDFGLAKLKGTVRLSRTSSTIGTLAYMAPEQIQGEEVDGRSDIFSFGIVLYELLTGHLPFKGEHEAAMVYSITNEEPEPLQHYLPGAPSELLHILNRALEKDREERYQSVHEMLIDLRRLRKDSSRVSRPSYDLQPPSTKGVEKPAVTGKRSSKVLLWLGVAAVAVIALLSLYVFLLRNRPVRLNPNRTSTTIRIPFKLLNYHSLSRDGNWVAFPARAENGTWDLYWMNTAGGEPIRLTREEAYLIDGSDISPDVSQIVYSCRRSPLGTYAVKIVPAHGGESRTLADTGGFVKWSPDVRRIGYARFGREGAYPSASGKFEIWSALPDGSDKRLELIDTVCTWGNAFAFCWSPDGRSIAWVRNFPGDYGEVMVCELATGRERQLTSDRKTTDEVVWTTNDQILFISNRGGQDNLWMVPAGGGEPVQLTAGGIPVLSAMISDDLKTLVYAYKEKLTSIWISGADGSTPHQLTFDEVRIFSGRFSPDGRHIAYIVGDVTDFNKERHLHLMERDGTNRRQLTSGPVTVTDCAWSTNGRWIAYSSLALGDSAALIRTYLLQPFNPAPPRLLCSGTPVVWADSASLFVFHDMKTFRYSISDGKGSRFYLDSTIAVPFGRHRQVIFDDYRTGRNGIWIASVDERGSPKGEARRILHSADDWMCPEDYRFFIFRKGDDLWRLSGSTWKEERIGTALQGRPIMYSISMDGKQILWIKGASRSKLVLVKNLFE